MPAIPLSPRPAAVGQISPLVGAPQSQATGEAFGAASGAAFAGVGTALIGVGDAVSAYADKKQGIADNLAATTSIATNSFAPQANDITTNYPDPTGKGLPETMQARYLKWVNDTYASDIKSGMSVKAADMAKLERLRQASAYTTTAANDATKMANASQMASSDQAAATQIADIRVHGKTSQADIFDREKTFYAQTDARTDIPQWQKTEIKANWSSDAVIARIQAGIDAAKQSPTGALELAALRKEVSGEFYTSRIKTSAILDQQLGQIDAAQVHVIAQQNAQLNASLDYLTERAKQAVIPQEELNNVFKLHEGLGGNITAEVQKKYHEIMIKQTTFIPNDGKSTTELEAAKRAVEAGGQPAPSGGLPPPAPGQGAAHAPAGQAPLQPNDPRLAPVHVADGRTFMVDKRFQTRFQGFINDYEAAGGVIGPNSGTLGSRNNGSYHPDGGAMDVNQVGRGKRAGGKTLPLDVEDKIAAKWGLRSGNHFADNDNGHFDAGSGGTGGRGGGGASGRVGAGGAGSFNFIGALGHFESHNSNVTNPEMTSSGNARGWIQITDGTWKEFGGLATGYKTAQDAPYAVQIQIGSKIPMGRWAKETLDKMRAAGFSIDPNKTMGENAIANGAKVADFSGAGGATTAGGGAPVVAGAPVSQPAVAGAPVSQPVVTPTGDGIVAQAPLSYEAQLQRDTLDAMITERKAGIAADPVSYMAAHGGSPIAELVNPAGYSQRIKDYGAIKQLEPTADKPFTVNEAARADTVLKSGNSDEINKLYAGIQLWPEWMRNEAYAQLGDKNPFGAATGRLYANGQSDLANTAYDGHMAMEGATKGGSKVLWEPAADKWMQTNMDAVLQGMNPENVDGTEQVIKGIYASKYGLGADLNQQNLQKVAESVLNGVFDKVNSVTTLVPKDTTGALVEQALRAPTLNLTELSVTNTPPLAEDRKSHALVEVPLWEAANAHLIPLGENTYMVSDADGGLWHTKTPDGPAVYKMHLDPQTIQRLALDAQRQGASNPDQALQGGQVPTPAVDENNPYFGSGFVAPAAPAPPTIPGQEPQGPSAVVTPPQSPINPPPPSPPTVSGKAGAGVGVGVGANTPPIEPLFTPAQNPITPPPTKHVTSPAELEKIYQENAKTFGDILRRNGASEAHIKDAVENYIKQQRGG